MTTIWYEDLQETYDKLEKIDINDIVPGTIRFIVYSEEERRVYLEI